MARMEHELMLSWQRNITAQFVLFNARLMIMQSVQQQRLLKERTTNLETGRTFYMHKNLRSAYRSLKSNLPWLFTWYDNIELKIPNTTNAIDGHFADLKNKLRCHNGLSVERKKKFIDGFWEV